MTIEIRRAIKEDADLIAELNVDVQLLHSEALPWMFKKPSPDHEIAEEFRRTMEDPGYFVFVASFSGKSAGYLIGEICQRNESHRHKSYGMLYVHHISIRPLYRRNGVGRALLDAARIFGKNAGVERMALDVWTFNESAQRFFRNYGLESYNEKMWMKV
jgi:diamine N-acetyltransferase